MSVGVRQVSRASRVTPTDGALLEVTLQDITAGEGVLAENTHVRAITGVCKSRGDASLVMKTFLLVTDDDPRGPILSLRGGHKRG